MEMCRKVALDQSGWLETISMLLRHVLLLQYMARESYPSMLAFNSDACLNSSTPWRLQARGLRLVSIRCNDYRHYGGTYIRLVDDVAS
jgi:hypothetical protein